MKRVLIVLFAIAILAPSALPQTPPPVPPEGKKAEAKKPEKAEQEPRPEQQELQKQQSQKKDAPKPAAVATAPAEAQKKEDKKWKVSDPQGPARHNASIDVTEGTWLSLDVSPDGKEIAFDLLGDIYTIPIGGGEAKALTTGIEWDMQPRYSP